MDRRLFIVLVSVFQGYPSWGYPIVAQQPFRNAWPLWLRFPSMGLDWLEIGDLRPGSGIAWETTEDL